MQISLEDLNALVSSAKELQKILTESPEVVEYLRLVKNSKQAEIVLPVEKDALLSAGEAAEILGTSKATIYRLVEEKTLPPFYTPHSCRMKFWLSDIKNVVRK